MFELLKEVAQGKIQMRWFDLISTIWILGQKSTHYLKKINFNLFSAGSDVVAKACELPDLHNGYYFSFIHLQAWPWRWYKNDSR